MKAKTSKLVKKLAKAPMVEDIGKIGCKRAMFSIKTKKRVAKYAINHGLKATQLASVYPKVTPAMISSWIRDHKAGRFVATNAVAVSRRAL